MATAPNQQPDSEGDEFEEEIDGEEVDEELDSEEDEVPSHVQAQAQQRQQLQSVQAPPIPSQESRIPRGPGVGAAAPKAGTATSASPLAHGGLRPVLPPPAATTARPFVNSVTVDLSADSDSLPRQARPTTGPAGTAELAQNPGEGEEEEEEEEENDSVGLDNGGESSFEDTEEETDPQHPPSNTRPAAQSTPAQQRAAQSPAQASDENEEDDEDEEEHADQLSVPTSHEEYEDDFDASFGGQNTSGALGRSRGSLDSTPQQPTGTGKRGNNAEDSAEEVQQHAAGVAPRMPQPPAEGHPALVSPPQIRKHVLVPPLPLSSLNLSQGSDMQTPDRIVKPATSDVSATSSKFSPPVVSASKLSRQRCV